MPPSSQQAIRAGGAFVQLFADDSQLVRGLKNAEAQLQNFGRNIRNIGLGVSALGSSILAPLGLATKTFSDMGFDVVAFSQRIGFSTNAVQEFIYSANQAGVEVSNLETGIRSMQRAIYLAGTGFGEHIEALKTIGLSYKELAGLSPEEQFYRIADAMSELTDMTTKGGVATKLFGQAGTNLLPLFQGGADGIAVLRQEAHKLGLVLGYEDLMASRDFAQDLKKLWSVVRVVAFSIGSSLMPALKPVLKQFVDLAVSTSQWVKENGPLFLALAKIAAVVTAVGAAITALGIAIQIASVFFGLATAAAGALAASLSLVLWVGGLLASAILAILSPLVALTALCAGISIAFARAALSTSDAKEAISGLGSATQSTYATVKNAITNFIRQFAYLQEAALAAFGGIRDALGGGDIKLAAVILWQALKVEFTRGINNLQLLWLGFKGYFLDTAGDIFYGAAKIAQDAWDGMQVAMDELITGLLNALTRFTTAFGTAMTTLYGSVTRGLLYLYSGIDKDFDYNRAVIIQKANQDADLAKAQKDAQDAINQRNFNLAKKRQDTAETNAQIKMALDAANKAERKARQGANQQKADKAAEELAKLVAEYNASLLKAKGLPRYDFMEALAKQTRGGDGQTSQLSNTIAKGTFSAMALQSLQAPGGSVAKQELDVLRDMFIGLNQIKKMVSSIDDTSRNFSYVYQ